MANSTAKEDKVGFCLDWIKRIQNDMSTLESNRQDALNYFHAKELGNEIKGRSQVVTSVLSDTINWVMPSMLKLFAGGDDVTTLSPRGPEDVEGVANLNELVNYQLKVKNKWFIVFHDWLQEACLMKVGVVKYQWNKDTRRVKKVYEDLTDAEYLAKITEISRSNNMEVETHSEVLIQEESFDPMTLTKIPAIKSHNLTVIYTIEEESPLIEAVPVEEVGFPLNTRDIESCRFFYHRVRLDGWEVKKKYGEKTFKKIEDLKNGEGTDVSDVITQQRYQDLGGTAFLYDKNDDKYTLYECFYPDKDTGEPRIIVICGTEIAKDEENFYGKPTFRIITPFKLAHRVTGQSFFDILKQLHDIDTQLLRQTLDNIYFTNNGRYIVDDTRVEIDDFLNNNIPGGVIRGDPTAVQALVPPTLQPWAFSLAERIKKDTEYRSGVPRAWAGIGTSLNKTFRGQAQQVSQASQRIEMMASLIAEMGVAPLIKDIVDMNIMFLKKKTAIRTVNNWVEINPDNIACQYDITVNVGIGVTSKDQIVAQMQQLLGIYGQISKSGVPVVTAQNVYKAMKELVKAMGFRNTNDFVTDPKQIETVTNLVKLVMMRLQQNGIQDPELMQAIQAVMALQGGGQADTGTFPGQNTPEMPTVEAQPMNPSMTPDGGGYFA